MFIGLIILFSIIGIISTIIAFTEDGEAFFITIICCGVIWLTCEHFDYKEDFPKAIPHSELQIAIMDEVAIIRHHDRTYEYNSVREYKAIRDGVFLFVYIQNYDVLGEFNGREYKLIIKPSTPKDVLSDNN